MIRTPFPWFLFALTFILVVTAGCTTGELEANMASATSAPLTVSSSPTPESTIAAPPSHTPPPTPVPTSTYTPLLTESATPTLTPLPTNTPTPAASPTPDLVMPGYYFASGCDSETLKWKILYQLCVMNVVVNQDRHMIFNMSWTLTNMNFPSTYSVTKESDQYNADMYVIDNLGNRYGHIAGGGEAYATAQMAEGVPVYGSFEFPAPPPGAYTFTFHDHNKELVIGDLKLTEPTILYGDLSLVYTPFMLSYFLEDWQSTTGDSGEQVLTHKEMPTCTLKELPYSQPQGNLKNRLDIGKLTYDIYGYIDQANNLGIREYVLVDGLPGLDPANPPFFVITIPLDTAEACIFAASDLLAGVYSK